jgi:hypothetical protein
MAAGGIYDHLGGGFARYSVDERWAVPHFEKMLYDNGQLVKLYADAYRLTGNRKWRRVFEESIAYVLRDMTLPEGGFYASEDADSEGEEGKFYVWTPSEVQAVLGDPDGLPRAGRTASPTEAISSTGPLSSIVRSSLTPWKKPVSRGCATSSSPIERSGCGPAVMTTYSPAGTRS